MTTAAARVRATAKDDAWVLGKTSTVNLDLSNLSPLVPITIQATDGTNKTSATLPVLALDAKK